MLVDIIFFTAQVLIIAACITVILFVKHMIKENSNDAAVQKLAYRVSQLEKKCPENEQSSDTPE